MKQMQKSHPRVAFFTFVFLAERGGFEPPVGYEPTHAFQACDLNHSSISPDGFSHHCEAAYYNKLSRLHKSILTSASPRHQHDARKRHKTRRVEPVRPHLMQINRKSPEVPRMGSFCRF
jgi:hypothetical protein